MSSLTGGELGLGFYCLCCLQCYLHMEKLLFCVSSICMNVLCPNRKNQYFFQNKIDYEIKFM